MRIIEVRDLQVPMEGNISNALVNFSTHTVSLVALVTDVRRGGRPVVGLGFNSIGRYGQQGILRDRMIPRLLSAEPASLLAPDGQSFSAEAVLRCVMANEKPGGHGDRAGAAGALELAVWDLNAKLAEIPAHLLIARHFGREAALDGVPVYAAGGYYYPGQKDRIREELLGYQALGFDAYKMKIGGASLSEDMARIEAALKVAGDGARLAVDANGRFDLDTALAYGHEMAAYGLRWYEEPGDPLDFLLNHELAQAYEGRLATGENLFSLADVMNLLRYAGLRPGLDVFQMDAGISYGLTEYVRMLDAMERAGYDRKQAHPHGGHLINLHIAAGLGLGGCEAYPGVFQPFGGYPRGCGIGGGRVRPTDAPGFGLEEKPELAPVIAKLLA